MANDVYVTGTFDDWGKSVQLNKVADVWEKKVEIPKTVEKLLYKFVVNDEWVIDPDAHMIEDDNGSICNVLYPGQIKPQASAGLEVVTPPRAAPENVTNSSTSNFHHHSSPVAAPEPTRYDRSPERDDVIDQYSKPPTPTHKPTPSKSHILGDFDVLIRDPPSTTEPTLPPPPSINKFAARKTRSGGYRERSPPPPPPTRRPSFRRSDAASLIEPLSSSLSTEAVNEPSAGEKRWVLYRDRHLLPPVKKTSVFGRLKNAIIGTKNHEEYIPKYDERQKHLNAWNGDDKDESDRWSITADNGKIY